MSLLSIKYREIVRRVPTPLIFIDPYPRTYKIILEREGALNYHAASVELERSSYYRSESSLPFSLILIFLKTCFSYCCGEVIALGLKEAFLCAHKMYFWSSSYRNAEIEVVFIYKWTARSSSSWLRKKRRELWRGKKPL
uniref:Uncharacterized protein n=1 Tax=Salix viminalis TaxID=40686 RepID=A0A6N2N595_SALVM